MCHHALTTRRIEQRDTASFNCKLQKKHQSLQENEEILACFSPSLLYSTPILWGREGPSSLATLFPGFLRSSCRQGSLMFLWSLMEKCMCGLILGPGLSFLCAPSPSTLQDLCSGQNWHKRGWEANSLTPGIACGCGSPADWSPFRVTWRAQLAWGVWVPWHALFFLGRCFWSGFASAIGEACSALPAWEPPLAQISLVMGSLILDNMIW